MKANNKLLIALVGLPGSGKSTAGRQLARKLELPFFDSDSEIEVELGQTIQSFFAQNTEDVFRDVEEAVIERLTLELATGGILATGGGVVLRKNNRERLRSRAMVFYLRSTPRQLYKRLVHDTKRPLLQGGGVLEKLETMYSVRDPLYRDTADFTIDTAGMNLHMLVRRVLMQIELMH